MTKRTKIVMFLAGGLVAAGVVAGGLSTAYGGRDFGCGEYGGHGAYGGHGRHHGLGGSMPGERMARLIERFDTDQDMALSQAELDAGKAAVFADFDADGNGSLELGEFQALWLDFARPIMVDRFQMLDDDGDARITGDEFERPLALMMRHLDRNRDGKLEPGEMRRRHRGHGTGADGGYWKSDRQEYDHDDYESDDDGSRADSGRDD